MYEVLDTGFMAVVWILPLLSLAYCAYEVAAVGLAETRAETGNRSLM